MKAKLCVHVECSCGWVMCTFSNVILFENGPWYSHPLLPTTWLECTNLACANYSKKFQIPEIRLECTNLACANYSKKFQIPEIDVKELGK